MGWESMKRIGKKKIVLADGGDSAERAKPRDFRSGGFVSDESHTFDVFGGNARIHH